MWGLNQIAIGILLSTSSAVLFQFVPDLALGSPTSETHSQIGTLSRPPIIGILPAKDRSLTLTYGNQIRTGAEIRFLIAEQILAQGNSQAVFLKSPIDRPTRVDFTVEPVVKSLVYASGSKSNRIVFGFTPEMSTPFDNEHGYQNEFVISSQDVCQKPDFFNGSFAPSGWGPFRSNFGVNADEGFDIKILGYGLSYRSRKFQIRSQVGFEVTNMRTGAKHTVEVDVHAKGSDRFVAAAYNGISLGVEVQRRQTLVEALRRTLPVLVSEFLTQGISTSTSAAATATSTRTLEIDLGEIVSNSTSDTSSAAAQSAEDSMVHLMSQCAETSKKKIWVEVMESLFSFVGWLRYKNVFDQEFSTSPTKIKSTGHQVRGSAQKDRSHSARSGRPLRVAILDTGVDPKDSTLQSRVAFDEFGRVRGYDFVSWDRRPSDDNGHGTAVARLLVEKLGDHVEIVPVKVVGGRSESTSSAIYAGIRFAVEQEADVLLMAWSTPHTLAIEKAVQDLNIQIPLILASDMAPLQGGTVAPQRERKAYKTQSLGNVNLKLKPAHRDAVVELARWARERGY